MANSELHKSKADVDILSKDEDTQTIRPTLEDQRLLLFSIFIIAGCSLIYELLISSLSTYLLGSGVIHYSEPLGYFCFLWVLARGWRNIYAKTYSIISFALK